MDAEVVSSAGTYFELLVRSLRWVVAVRSSRWPTGTPGKGAVSRAGAGCGGSREGKVVVWESHNIHEIIPSQCTELACWTGQGAFLTHCSLLYHSVGLTVTLFFTRSVSRATLRVEKQHAWIILHKLPALRYWVHNSLSLFLSLSSCLS